jgi:hypothetical protein
MMVYKETNLLRLELGVPRPKTCFCFRLSLQNLNLTVAVPYLRRTALCYFRVQIFSIAPFDFVDYY